MLDAFKNNSWGLPQGGSCRSEPGLSLPALSPSKGVYRRVGSQCDAEIWGRRRKGARSAKIVAPLLRADLPFLHFFQFLTQPAIDESIGADTMLTSDRLDLIREFLFDGIVGRFGF